MHITLLNSPSVVYTGRRMKRSQCVGLLYIAAYLRSRGHTITFIDALADERDHATADSRRWRWAGLTASELATRIPADADLVGISAPFSRSAFIVHEVVRELKARYPLLPIVLGGAYPSAQPLMAAGSEADFVIRGEGEIPLSLLINALTARLETLIYP